MIYDNYLLYVLGTIDGYTIKVKKHLRKLFIEKNIIQKYPQMTIDGIGEDNLDVSEMALTESVKYAIENNKKAVKIFEKWEFEKDYKYSVLFNCNGFDEVIKSVESEAKIQGQLEDESSLTSESFNEPIYYDNDDLLMIKFNMLLSVIDLTSQNELLMKYPFIVLFNKKYNIVEFRFDVIRRVFLSEKDEQCIYSVLVKNIRKILNDKFNITLSPLDLDFMTNLTNANAEDAIIMAEYKKLPNGGNAQLEVGKNEDYRLPIIGDLKEIIEKYKAELDKVPSLYNALNQFIFENDELSDYTWLEIMWPAEVKTRSIRVKFIFNYKGENYTLIQHYSNNALVGMERMNNVTEYINRYKGLNQTTSQNE